MCSLLICVCNFEGSLEREGALGCSCKGEFPTGVLYFLSFVIRDSEVHDIIRKLGNYCTIKNRVRNVIYVN